MRESVGDMTKLGVQIVGDKTRVDSGGREDKAREVCDRPRDGGLGG